MSENNTSYGSGSLNNNLGKNNSAFGAYALYNNLRTKNNTAVGADSMFYGTTGSNNTAVGAGSLCNNSGGSLNTAIGSSALEGIPGLTSGGIFIGDQNTAVGAQALYSNNGGNLNTAIGTYAGLNAIDGSGNTFLGAYTDFSDNTFTHIYSTALGYNAKIDASNQIMMGGFNDGIYPDVLIPGTAHFTTYTPYTYDELSIVPKIYVDAVTQGLSPKGPVTAATTQDASGYITGTYSYISPGTITGITSPLDGFGNLIIDTITIQDGSSVLINYQQNQPDVSGNEANGIYIWNKSAASLRRRKDLQTGSDATGAFCFVKEGKVNGRALWVQANTSPLGLGNPYFVGTNPLDFVFYSQFDFKVGRGLQFFPSTIDTYTYLQVDNSLNFLDYIDSSLGASEPGGAPGGSGTLNIGNKTTQVIIGQTGPTYGKPVQFPSGLTGATGSFSNAYVSGNVVIGTSSGGSSLSFTNFNVDSSSSILFSGNTDNASIVYNSKNDASSNLTFTTGDNTNEPMYFQQYNLGQNKTYNRMTINQGVGINLPVDVTPQYPLDVSGNSILRNTVYAPGGITGATGSFTYLSASQQILLPGGITGATGSFTYLSASQQISAPGGITGGTGSFTYLSASNLISAPAGITGGTGSFTYLSASKQISAPAGITGATGSFTYLSASQQISAPGGITGGTGSFNYLKFNGNGLDISGNLIINNTIYANGGITGATGSFTYLQGLTGSFRYLSGYTGAFQNLTVGNIFANYIDVSGNLQIYNVPGITDSLQVYRSDSSVDPTGTYLFYNKSGSLGNYSQNPSSVLWQIDNSGNASLNTISGKTGSFTYLTTTEDASINGITVGKGSGSISTNTAVGYQASNANTSSYDNTAVGYQALKANTSGHDNTAIGYQALNVNKVGADNTAIGSQALQSNTTNGKNTAIGSQALNINTEALNTAIGYAAGSKDASGNYNTYIGTKADASNNLTKYNNSTAIGYNATIDASYQMVLGGLVTTDTNPIHPRIKIPGSYVGIGGVYNPTNGFALDVSGITHILGNLDVSGNAYAYTFTTTSDYRIKENPTPLDDTYIVDKLNPLTYRNKLTGKTDIGLIAHELQDEYPCLVFGEKDAEEYQRVNYSGLIPILIKEVKELKQRVKTLEEERNHV